MFKTSKETKILITNREAKKWTKKYFEWLANYVHKNKKQYQYIIEKGEIKPEKLNEYVTIAARSFKLQKPIFLFNTGKKDMVGIVNMEVRIHIEKHYEKEEE